VKTTVHRAAAEAGNAFVELKTEKTRILIDPVSPYDADTVDAVLLSRFSPDLVLPDPKTPCYVSFGVKALIEASHLFIHGVPLTFDARILKERDKKPVRIGDLAVHVYPAGNCGFDARAFLVEAGDERALYVNRLTVTGKKGRFFEALVNDKSVNFIEEALPDAGEHEYHDHEALRAAVSEALGGPASKAFLCISAYDVDGIASAYRACRAAGAVFVMDLSVAFILAMVRRVSKRVPQYDSDRVRVRFSADLATALKDAGYGPLVHAFGNREHKIDIFELNRSKRRLLFAVRDEHFLRALAKELDDVKDARAISAAEDGINIRPVS